MSTALFAGVSERAVNVGWPPKSDPLRPEGVRVWIDDRETADFSIAPDGTVTVPGGVRGQCTMTYHLPAVWGPRL